MKALWIAACIVLAGYTTYRTYRIATREEGLGALIERGAIILDVRTVWEFERGHITRSVNIPLSHLHKDPLPLDKNAVIITCCSHGLRSVKARSVLYSRGYWHVYNGGAWSDLQGIATAVNRSQAR